MKQFYIIVLLLLITHAIDAQGNFAPLGAKWTYSTIMLVPPNTFGPYVMEVVAIDSYQGKTCSKIYMPFNHFGPWIEDDTLYVFEKSDSVYFWSPYSENFELLYDFTAEVGDSWIIGGLSVPDPIEDEDFTEVTVDSIEIIVLNGDSLAIMHHHYYPNHFDWGRAIIRGIGSMGFMFPSFGLYEIGIGRLRCYSDSEREYKFVPYLCDSVFTTSVTDLDYTGYGITIAPNPVEQSMVITSDQYISDSSIQIYSLLGQLVYSGRFLMPCSVDIDFLQSGIYFCGILSGNNLVHMERIVKLP